MCMLRRILEKMATLKMLKLFLSTLSLFVSFPTLIQGEVVHITVLTEGYTDVGTSIYSGRYQCYPSEPDTDATLSFGRSALITTDRSPPEDVQHSTRLPFVRRVIFPIGDGWDRDGFGPFYCEASKSARDVTRVTTFFQRIDAKFISSDESFTRTVNVNDTGVMISMTSRTNPDANDNVITWRKDGSEVLPLFGGHTQISFPNPIQTSDQGIYEIYYNNERSQNRGGLYRLIVRECLAGRWGPPECYGVCDKCYNGGVCDDKSGLCICPNNFNGTNCLEICRNDGGNRFGLNCEFRCTYRYDRIDKCHGLLFCLPDPFGCSCDVGAHGLACNTLCTIGTYGPGCSQTCHCEVGSSCDIYSGICTGGCQTGWSGDNCQIPDECEDGYYGPQCTDKCHCLNDEPCDKDTGDCPEQRCALGYKLHSGQVNCQECEGGTFGLDCLQQCHCAQEACEAQRGLCKGQCLETWFGPYCERRSRLVPVRVNPYQPSSFTCYVEGNPLPDASSVDLYRRTESTYNRTGITRGSSTVSGSERAVVFDIDSVYPQEYVCIIYVENVGYLSTPIANATYVLPVIGQAPVIVSTTSTTVGLRWIAWSAEDDIGDPPLVGYDVFVRKDGGDWDTDQRVDPLTTSAIVSGLTPDTYYRFRVAAAREGTGAIGPASPWNDTITLCRKPRASPTRLHVSATNPKELEVTWEHLPSESAECRSGVTHYMIYYASTGSTSSNSILVRNDTSSYTIRGLETYLDYTIQISVSNKDEESARSSESIHKTIEEVAPSPINLAIPRSTTSSFTLSWSTPLPYNINGNIQKYIIRYKRSNHIGNGGYKMEEVLNDAFEGEHTVVDLTAKRTFSVQVQTVNGAGSSNWSEPVNARTIQSGSNKDV